MCIYLDFTGFICLNMSNFQTQLTIWNAGCEEKLISEMMSVSWRFNAVMALIIVAMVFYLQIYNIQRNTRKWYRHLVRFLINAIKEKKRPY